MAIGDPINAGIGSYDPTKNYFAQPQRRGAGLLSPSDLNLSTVPGQSQMDALNAIRERLGMRPLDQGLGSKFSIAPTGMTKGQAKQQQMTVGEYDIGRKLAALDRPNTMTQVTSALQDDPSAYDAGFIDPFDITASPLDIETYQSTVRSKPVDAELEARIEREERGDFGDDGLIKDTTTGSADSGEEAGGLGEANADQALVFSGTSEGAGDPTKTPKSAFEAALVEAMKDYEDTQAGEDTGTKDIDYYKQKFSEATGIDTSGKVDKSQALMAFGLALMQNKAGKGFNVGNILNAVGAAGEKAQPLLAKAQSEARAAQLAGGKYALNQVAKDEADRKASITAALQRVQTLQDKAIDAQDKINLEVLKGRLKAQQERIKAEGAIRKAVAEKGDPDLYTDKTESLPLFKDAPDAFNITAFIQDPNAKGDIPVKLTNGSEAGLKAQFNASERALNKAEDELTRLTNIVSKQGITTQQQIAAYINSFGRGFGINVDQSLDAVAEAKIILERIATQQAPEILGESGKTISDADRERVTRIVGDIGLLAKADPQVIMQKLKSVYGLIVESGRNNLDTAYEKLHAMGYDYGPFAQQQQQQGGAFTPSSQQQKILGKYGI